MTVVTDFVTVGLIAIGAFFLLIGTIGLVRLPDVYNRMHATSKATTIGASGMLLAAFVHFGPFGDGLVALITVLFLFLTAPTGAHLISRSAQRMGIEFEGGARWPGGESEDIDDPTEN